MTTTGRAREELTLLVISEPPLSSEDLDSWRAGVSDRVAVRCVPVADAAEARAILEASAVSLTDAALLGVVRVDRTAAVVGTAPILDGIVRQVADGRTSIAWAQGRLRSGGDAAGDLVGALLDDDMLPAAVAPSRLWRTALDSARGLSDAALTARLFSAMDSFVMIDPAQHDGPRARRALSTGDVVTGGRDVADLVTLMHTALELGRLAVPGWAEHAPGVCDRLLRGALRSPHLDREQLADGLRALTSDFDPGDDRLYSERNREILQTIRAGDRDALVEALRTRLLVVGHDLKFIDFMYDYLPGSVAVREDRWLGEKRHDAEASRQLAAWADVIWVEWLAHSALWYSRVVRDDQVLIVRQHRYELLRDVGEQIDYRRVSAVIAIAVHTLEGVHERFAVPRDKLRLVPNIYEADRYTIADPEDEGRQFRIALVGSIPRLKGLHRAIEVLEHLRGIDERYTLTIFGRRPEELPWVRSNHDEAAYFDACDQYLRTSGLESAVQYAGWVDIRKELHRYGYVLSTSDLEGSHVSPGEAYLTGNLGVYLRWRGSEYIYPEEFGFESPDELARYIASEPLRSGEVRAAIRATATRLAEEQGVSAFLASVQAIVHERPL